MAKAKSKRERHLSDPSIIWTIRWAIAYWEFTRLHDPETRADALKGLKTTVRGSYNTDGKGSGYSLEKKGIRQRIAMDVVEGRMADDSERPDVPGAYQLSQGLKGEWYVMWSWDDIVATVLSCPQEPVDAVRAASKAYEEHRRTFVLFKASAKAQGCGPIPRNQPRETWTAAQRLYDDEYQKWWDEVREPHEKQASALYDQTVSAYQACIDALVTPDQYADALLADADLTLFDLEGLS